MILIAGLGNPGKKYGRTRHNAGFMALERLREKLAAGPAVERFESELWRARAGGESVLLMAPQTFMNLSGLAVGAAASFYKVLPSNVWILHDELDLPLGRLRIRRGGSSSHNGIRSVVEKLGTQEFARFRIGIGRPAADQPLPVEDYVLQSFGKEEEEAARTAIERTADACLAALQDGLDLAMNRYNSA